MDLQLKRVDWKAVSNATIQNLMGTAKVNCSTSNCHPNIDVHQPGINSTASANFHGKYIATAKITMDKCNQCHGDNFAGKVASPACSNCHADISVHKAGITTASSPNFHGKFIKSKNWSMTTCTPCHGINYSGKVASPSCNTCHKNPGGPEACNTCHGDFNNPSLIAPPTDLSKNTDTKIAGVGAHAVHLLNTKIGPLVKCNDCHTIPTGLYSSGHLDSTPKAELVFRKFASNEVGSTTYDFTTNKCASNYCHGSFSFTKSSSQYQFAYTADKMEGNYFQPIWNKVDGTQATCGTCHGLPPTGHVTAALKDCATCHPGVVDQYGKIIDKTKHMDGKINVFGN